MPHTTLGWWAFGLMLAAVASPIYWGVLTALIRQSDPEAQWRTTLVIAIVVPAVVVGVAALVRHDARSLGLMALFAVLAIELAWVVFFVASFGNGTLGVWIVVGAVAAGALGVLVAARIPPARTRARD